MNNEDTSGNAHLSIAELEGELWEKKLHDPEVFDELVRNKGSLKLMTVADILLLIGILAVTAWLIFAVHWSFALVGGSVVLIFLGKKRRRLSLARNEIDFFIGDPSEIFNSIAVNKIMMEACDRSTEVERYVRAVNQHRRFRMTAFENETMVKILGALDRQEKEASGNDKYR